MFGRCRRTSVHPKDVTEGYCGACHDWTGPRFAVIAEVVGRRRGS
jgi:hypothetical protein